MNRGFPYSALRRDKSNDIPRGEGYEWVVATDKGLLVDTLLIFEDGPEGWQVANNIAEAMNAAYDEGAASVRAALKAIITGD